MRRSFLFWRKLVLYVPKDATASSITALGLAAGIAASLATVILCPNFDREAPSWLFVLNAVTLWFYQTADAVDGKQSYRTQCCELEEFTDHGADSITTISMAMMLAAALQMTTYYPTLCLPLFLLCMSALYTTHCVSYFTHSCVFEKFDVTEVQWVAIGISLVTAWKGQSFWSRTLFTLSGYSVRPGLLMIIASGTGFANKMIQNLLIVRGAPTPLEAAGIRIPRRRPSIRPYSILIFHLLLAFLDLLSPSSNFNRQPVLFMAIHGFGIARASCRLVIHSMTRAAMPTVDSSLLAPLLSASITLLTPLQKDSSTALALYAFCALMAIADHGLYCTLAIRDICEARDVYTFSLKSGQARVIDQGFYIAGTTPTGVPDAVKRWEAWKGNPANKRAFTALYGVK